MFVSIRKDARSEWLSAPKEDYEEQLMFLAISGGTVGHGEDVCSDHRTLVELAQSTLDRVRLLPMRLPYRTRAMYSSSLHVHVVFVNSRHGGHGSAQHVPVSRLFCLNVNRGKLPLFCPRPGSPLRAPGGERAPTTGGLRPRGSCLSSFARVLQRITSVLLVLAELSILSAAAQVVGSVV